MIQNCIKKLKQKIVRTHLFNLLTARLHQAKRREELKKVLGNVIEKYQSEPLEQVVADEKVSN